MPGFGLASAPVASCGVLGFLEASSSYKIDYIPPAAFSPDGRTVVTANQDGTATIYKVVADEDVERLLSKD